MSEQSQDCSICPQECKIIGTLKLQYQGNTGEHRPTLSNKWLLLLLCKKPWWRCISWQHGRGLCKHVQHSSCCFVFKCAGILHCTASYLRVIVIKWNCFFAFDLRFHWLCLSAFEKWLLILNATVVAPLHSPSQKCILIPFSERWIFVSCERGRGDKIAPNMSIIAAHLQMDQLSFRRTVPQGPEHWTAYIFHWVLMPSWNLLNTWKLQRELLFSDTQALFLGRNVLKEKLFSCSVWKLSSFLKEEIRNYIMHGGKKKKVDFGSLLCSLQIRCFGNREIDIEIGIHVLSDSVFPKNCSAFRLLVCTKSKACM